MTNNYLFCLIYQKKESTEILGEFIFKFHSLPFQ